MKTSTAAALTYTILSVTTSPNPLQSARLLGACLAADKGYSSEIVKVDRKTVDCVASDGRAVRFTFRPEVVRRVTT